MSTKTVLTSVENSVELGLVIAVLVSSAYNTNVAFLDVIMGTSIINNKKNKGSRLDPCDMPCWTRSQLEKLLLSVLLCTITLWYLSVSDRI
jgi:hypothetical protein